MAASLTATFADVGSELLGGVSIQLSCSYVQGKPLGRPGGRAPLRSPSVSLTGNTLAIPEYLVGYGMKITSEYGDVVFSTTAVSTEVVIPDDLSGVYLIEFTSDSYCFAGIFSVE